MAAFSTCSGGTAANGGAYDRASDPWVSIGPDGTVYSAALTISADETVSAIRVSTSTDGGDTWSTPATIIDTTSNNVLNDKESVTADPLHPGRAYVVWDQITLPTTNAAPPADAHSFAYRGRPMFSRTMDGGHTWSAPAPIDSLANLLTIGNQVSVLPDGSLVDVTALFRGSGLQPSTEQDTEAAFISHDGGLSWSRPSEISDARFVEVVDPDNGKPVRAGTDIPDAAVDWSSGPTRGTIYAVWGTGDFAGGRHDDIAISKSTDGGLTWSAESRANQTPNGAAAFTPNVAVNADGTVAVGYDDFRNNTPAPGLPTDWFLAHSHDGGASWSETRVTPSSFDMETAPVARGYFIGDYQGIATIGSTFVPVLIQTTTTAGNPTDAWVASIG